MANRWHTASRTSPATQARRRKYASPEHRAAYNEYKRRQAAGEWLTCWRTGHLIPPTVRCHVGHDDTQVNLIRGPECPPCNLKAAARKGNRVAKARTATLRPVRRVTRRDWLQG